MIDLTAVQELWEYKAELLVDALNGANLDDTEDQKDKAGMRSAKAELSRKLLELADICAMMETVVRNEYWIYKGSGIDMEIGFYDD